MWAICKKEFRQFFSNLTGYITIILFLLLNGLFLFVFSSFNILEFGYATLDNFFTLAPFCNAAVNTGCNHAPAA
jgi:ABC-2 type transport system permease protein